MKYYSKILFHNFNKSNKMAKNLKTYFTSKKMYFFVRKRKCLLYNVLHWNWEQNSECQQQFYTYTTYIICWKTAQRATHTSHSHFSLIPALATISSSTLFDYLLFKFSIQHFNIFLSASSLKINQEGRSYSPRKLRIKKFCKCIHSWAEKDISEQLYSLKYDSIPQSSQQSKYCKWRRHLKINLMNDNYLYCIKYTDSKNLVIPERLCDQVPHTVHLKACKKVFRIKSSQRISKAIYSIY